MADLPDLDTSNISYLAYWNAIDQGGVGSIDPEEVLSDNNIDSYTLYDNGIEIAYNGATGRKHKARVKTDGWVISWFDRTENFSVTEPNLSNVRGWWDIANDWTTEGNFSATQNTLERCIYSLSSQFSNFGSMTYNATDVSLYNYEYPNATATTAMSVSNYGITNHGFSYTDNTTIYAAAAFAFSTDAKEGSREVFFEGTRLIGTSTDRNEWGCYDIYNNGLLPNAGTEYTLEAKSHNDLVKTSGGVLILWG